jgi:hypothetical protein
MANFMMKNQATKVPSDLHYSKKPEFPDLFNLFPIRPLATTNFLLAVFCKPETPVLQSGI